MGRSPDAAHCRFAPPKSISPEAQEALTRPWPDQSGFPPLDDSTAWVEFVTARNEEFAAMWPRDTLDAAAAAWSEMIGGVPVVRARSNSAPIDDERIYFDIHGGALIFCWSMKSCLPASNWYPAMGVAALYCKVMAIWFSTPYQAVHCGHLAPQGRVQSP